MSDEVDRCFFCGRAVVPESFDATQKSVGQWLSRHGSFARMAGKVGAKFVCIECRTDLSYLVG